MNTRVFSFKMPVPNKLVWDPLEHFVKAQVEND